MTRVVSVTPLSVGGDSRTYRHAASFARFGHESLVVEDLESPGLDRESLPFALVTARSSAGGVATVEAVPAPAVREDRAEAVRASALARGALARYRRLPASARRLPAAAAALPVSIAAFLYSYGVRTARVLPPAELYYLHSYHQYPAVRILCRRHGARYVYDAHDCYSALKDGQRLRLRARVEQRFHEWIERRAARNAAAIVTVSDGVAELLRERFGREVVVVRNAHDSRLDERSAGGTDIRSRLALGDDAFLVAMSGQLKAGMPLDTMIAAVEQLPDRFHLALVGRGYEAQTELREAAARTGRLHLVDPVAPTRIVPFLRTADAAAILYRPATRNLQNALPNGFFHAVAAGLPVLYGPLPEVERLATEHGLGWPVDSRDPAALAAAVARIADDADALHAAREHVARAAGELSWEREELRLKALVDGLLRHPPD